MDREFVLSEIRRVAREHGGKPPGREIFRQASGIRHHQWLGVYWSSWSAAVAEAGFEPNSLDVAFDKDFLLASLASAVRHLGKFPTEAELSLHARQHSGFPPPKAIKRHFKTKPATIAALVNYCDRTDATGDVLEICRPLLEDTAKASNQFVGSRPKQMIKGYVYLIHSGRYHKIGKSNHVGRREYQIALKVPEPVKTVHSIATDDPDGIEAYWHNRFKSKRAQGEWFTLTADDIRAFKLRSFM